MIKYEELEIDENTLLGTGAFGLVRLDIHLLQEMYGKENTMEMLLLSRKCY